MWRSLGLLASLAVMATGIVASAAPVLAQAAPATPAAQMACVVDAEPNDQPSSTTVLTGGLCIDGSSTRATRTCSAWEVPPANATARWTFRLAGVQDAVTTLQLLRITSDPGSSRRPLTPPRCSPSRAGPTCARRRRARTCSCPLGAMSWPCSGAASAAGLVDASPAYHASIERGAPLPARIDTEPNDDAATGVPESGAFSGSGDLATSDDHVRWVPGATEPGALWRLTLGVPLGASVRATVTTSDGLAWSTVTSVDGLAVFHDLGPDPDGYDVTLSHIDDQPLPYVLAAGPGAGRDARPRR
ncbi:MAG: hypothetical protein R3C32_13910 [Chloroflexota bacterium]